MKRILPLLALSALTVTDAAFSPVSAVRSYGEADAGVETHLAASEWRQSRDQVAQGGPLILPGAPPPGEAAAPLQTEGAPARGKAKPGVKPGKSSSAAVAPAAPAAPPQPIPEALPGFEHLAPPPPQPKAMEGSRQAGRGGAPGKGQEPREPEPQEATLPSEPTYVPETPPVRIVTPSMRAKPGEVVLQPMQLSDLGLLTRRRLVLADPTLTSDQGKTASAGRSRTVRTDATPTVRPLYPMMAFVPGLEEVYQSQVVQADSFDFAPIALNSVEALRDGVPIGPFRAGMIEDNPQGAPRIETGTAVWQIDAGPAMAERGPDAIRATAIIGKSQSRVELSIRNEPAAQGSAPLMMELKVKVPGDAVAQVGLPELRNPGVDRGVALYASVVNDGDRIAFAFPDSVTDGEQNVRLLTSRSWIDIPVRLKSGRRVVFAIERGTAVRDMMRESFRLWRLPWLP